MDAKVKLNGVKEAAVSGFATLDYVMTTARPLAGAESIRATTHTANGWPQAGGAALYASKRIALNGHKAAPIVHVGPDKNGRMFKAACFEAGLDIAGIETQQSGRTPCCVLVYHECGGYSCFLDAGNLENYRLSRQQLGQIERADLIVVAAAPRGQTEAVLALAAPHQTVAWILKDDPECFPRYLREKLSARADIIFCNESERGLIFPSDRPGQILVETKGSDGVTLSRGGQHWTRASTPLEVADATGAGDTLAGEVLSQIMSGETDFNSALDCGNDAARRLLLDRLQSA